MEFYQYDIFNLQDGKQGISLLNIDIWNNIVMWNSSPHFWYVFMLMFWTVLSPVLFVLYNTMGGRVILFAISLVYLIYKGNNVLHSRYIYILFAWAGVIGFRFPNLINKICRLKKKKIVMTTLLIAYLGMYFIYSDKAVGMGIKVWLYGLRGLLLLCLLINLPMAKIGSMTRFKYSFWVFAVHYWMDVYISAIAVRLVSNPLEYQMLTWFVVVALSLIIGMIVDKKTPVLFRLLSGNREKY